MQVEHLDFGLISHAIPKLPPHNAVSQTPRLKASTFKSPILGHAMAEPAKRASSLLDQDLAARFLDLIHNALVCKISTALAVI